jgi:hypothetical protein
MRFMIMHKTNAQWEAGAVPSRELIARVGALVGELAKTKVLLGAEGLRPSSEGARLKHAGGKSTISPGPLAGENELPAGLSILRAASLDEAVAWASRQAEVLGEAEIDVRPVTEPWDIGIVPKPAHATTRRYMALRKASAASEAGTPLSPEQQAGMARLIAETTSAGVHLATETLAPSRRGRRYKNTGGGVRVTDGPFAESKELIAGYVLISAESLEEAARWAARYLEVVEADEVDLREVEEAPAGSASKGRGPDRLP